MPDGTEGIVNFTHNGSNYAVPQSDIEGFLSRKPDAKILDAKSADVYNGWVQGRNAQQEIYSGVKPAPVPAPAGTVIVPGKAWEPTSQEPFYKPTAEEQQAANVKHKDDAQKYAKAAVLGQVPSWNDVKNNVQDIGTSAWHGLENMGAEVAVSTLNNLGLSQATSNPLVSQAINQSARSHGAARPPP